MRSVSSHPVLLLQWVLPGSEVLHYQSPSAANQLWSPHPPAPPLPPYGTPRALKLHCRVQAGCPPAVHCPAPCDRSRNHSSQLACSSFSPFFQSKSCCCFFLLLFPLTLPLSQLPGAGRDPVAQWSCQAYPGEPVWAESDSSLLTSVLQLLLTKRGIMGFTCSSENLAGRVTARAWLGEVGWLHKAGERKAQGWAFQN